MLTRYVIIPRRVSVLTRSHVTVCHHVMACHHVDTPLGARACRRAMEHHRAATYHHAKTHQHMMACYLAMSWHRFMLRRMMQASVQEATRSLKPTLTFLSTDLKICFSLPRNLKPKLNNQYPDLSSRLHFYHQLQKSSNSEV